MRTFGIKWSDCVRQPSGCVRLQCNVLLVESLCLVSGRISAEWHKRLLLSAVSPGWSKPVGVAANKETFIVDILIHGFKQHLLLLLRMGVSATRGWKWTGWTDPGNKRSTRGGRPYVGHQTNNRKMVAHEKCKTRGTRSSSERATLQKPLCMTGWYKTERRVTGFIFCWPDNNVRPLLCVGFVAEQICDNIMFLLLLSWPPWSDRRHSRQLPLEWAFLFHAPGSPASIVCKETAR